MAGNLDALDKKASGLDTKSRRLMWILVGVGVTIAVLLAAILMVLLGPGSNKEPGTMKEPGNSPKAAETFTAAGTLQMIGNVDGTKANCYGSGGYSDLYAGTQVIIRDASGDTVALGELGSGSVPDKFDFGSTIIACAWSFTVPDVPSGSSAYSVEVSHRGEISFTEETASAIGMTLGS